MNFWANVHPGFGSSENGAPLNGRSMTINLRTWPCRSCTWFGTVFPLNFLRQIVLMPEYCTYIYTHKYVYLSPSTYAQHKLIPHITGGTALLIVCVTRGFDFLIILIYSYRPYCPQQGWWNCCSPIGIVNSDYSGFPFYIPFPAQLGLL